MDFKRQLEERLARAAGAALAEAGAGEFSGEAQVEAPRSREHGDFATNLALQLAKPMRRPPREVAEKLLQALGVVEFIESAEIAGPGFINFRLKSSAAGDLLRAIIEAGAAYGRSAMGAGEKVNVEFVSANPTGPLHIGHARNAVVGDCIARLLEATGHDVTREYYFNDAGNQMMQLGSSLKARYKQVLGHCTLRDNLKYEYKGSYLLTIAEQLQKEQGQSYATKDIDAFTDYAVQHILKMIDADLKAMGIRFDVWFSETTLYKEGRVEAAIEKLKENETAYEQDGAWWLRSSQFGDEKDRVIIKSDGSKTYITPDIAYHEYKYQRGFHRVIDVLGGDHHGYIPRLRAGVQSLGYDAGQIQCVVIQMVTLIRGEERIKISTRAGDFLPLSHAIREIGPDVLRYFMVMRSADAQMNFDWELAKQQSMDNPVYYVQYAHARCASLFKKALDEGIQWEGAGSADLNLLHEVEERELIKEMARYPELVEAAARALEPQLIANYLRELAQTFHQYFTRGTKDASLRFVVPDNPQLTHARLSLIAALKVVLKNALDLLGVSAPERM